MEIFESHISETHIYWKGWFPRSGQLMPKTHFTEAYAAVVRALVEARKEAGLSQMELARRVGRDQPFISLVENCVRRLDVVEFFVLARAIGADPDALFSRATRDIPGGFQL